MKKSLLIEIILFACLTLALVFLGGKVFKHTFDIGTTYHISFNDIDGIVVGSPVRILGVDIGHVTKIQTAYDEIFVDFVVTNPDVKLPQGTHATIEFFGLAGSRSIELTPPDGKTNAQGILVTPPIRIGDAFDIMGEFLKATMVSIGGLYEFAKNKTLKEVENQTASLVKTTIEADDKIADITSVIQKGGANLHKSFKGTTKGMTRLYNETAALYPAENVNNAKYAINLFRRNLKKIHRNIKNFNKEAKEITAVANSTAKKIHEIYMQTQNVEGLHQAMADFDKAIIEFDKNLTQENLDKIYNLMENIRLLTQNAEKEI